MSFNRENVIWQSSDRSWNRGFFTATVTGDDPEWDVDYDFGSFEWVVTGLASEQAAIDAWTGPNPGAWTTFKYDDGNKETCKRFSATARKFKTANKPKRSRRQCSECKRNRAVWRVGNDGFGAKAGKVICDNWSCRSSATGGYPVTLHRI